MSRAAYERERQHLRERTQETQRKIQEQQIRALFPWKEQAAIEAARSMGRDTMKKKTDLSAYFIK